jgi:hypothetical protein
MKWFEKDYVIDDTIVLLVGSYEEGKVRIGAWIETNNGSYENTVLYEKPVNMWVHQEILAEDVLAKYQGMLQKCEKKLPTLVEKIKLEQSI